MLDAQPLIMKKTYLTLIVAITHPETMSPDEIEDIAKESMERGVATFPGMAELSAHCSASNVVTTIEA